MRFEDLSEGDQKAIREMRELLNLKQGPPRPTLADLVEDGIPRCGSCKYFQPAAGEMKCSSLHSGHYKQSRQYRTEACQRYALRTSTSGERP